MNKKFVALLLGILLLSSLQSASAGTLPPRTPATHIQVWTVNLRHLDHSWQGFVDRMATNGFAPDVVVVQETTENELITLYNVMRSRLDDDFAYVLSSTGQNGVIWATRRLSKIGSTITWPQQTNGCGNGKETVAVNLRDKAASDLFGETRNVVVGSIHFRTDGSDSCLNHSFYQAANTLNSLAVRRMTILAGDVNRRPDTRGETAANGLETDPGCWYQRFSAAHVDDAIGQLCGQGNYVSYYDAVWSYPGSGGLSNPTTTSFCQQYTHFTLTPAQPDQGDLMNSCTDLNSDGKLDRGRIDYIWVGYENKHGVPWRPSAAVVASHIDYASADTGLSFSSNSLAQNYSDHRAVQAVLVWPAMPNPSSQ